MNYWKSNRFPIEDAIDDIIYNVKPLADLPEYVVENFEMIALKLAFGGAAMMAFFEFLAVFCR